ncbi:MAG: hypothetical protein P4L65_03020 [Legionella sp.]|nr:hypothetical protein [Legionella sp.]
MTILQLIAEIRLSRANAISANVATDPESKTETVAKIATLAVADTQIESFNGFHYSVNTGLAEDDPRRYCSQCNNLSRSGQCLAAKRGDLHHCSRTYRPIIDILINCACFVARSVD